LGVPSIAVTGPLAAARLTVGRARCRLIVWYRTSWGPTEAKGGIIEKYLAPTLNVAIGTMYIPSGRVAPYRVRSSVSRLHPQTQSKKNFGY
jgi:hypothetical protein